MASGKYIVIEGIEGCGKSTQTRLLAEWLDDKAITTREPGGTPMAEAVRKVVLDPHLDRSPRTNLYLFSAARVEVIDNIVRPALTKGVHVISDRNWLTTIAYQQAGEQLDPTEIMMLIKQATAEFFEPDLTIIIDTKVETCLERLKIKVGTIEHFERRDATFFTAARDAYLDYAKKLKNCHVIDGNTDPQTIFAQIKQKASELLGDGVVQG